MHCEPIGLPSLCNCARRTRRTPHGGRAHHAPTAEGRPFCAKPAEPNRADQPPLL